MHWRSFWLGFVAAFASSVVLAFAIVILASRRG